MTSFEEFLEQAGAGRNSGSRPAGKIIKQRIPCDICSCVVEEQEYNADEETLKYTCRYGHEIEIEGYTR